MYVVWTKRAVKVGVSRTTQDRFAARSTNVINCYVSGPFKSHRAAQRAVLAALGQHTTLEAQVWSQEQIEEQHAKGYGANGDEKQRCLTESRRLLATVEGTPAM